uniref:Methyl-CpG-binding domain-containing protein 8 n=1 Tax=Nelumbo nucifera TaxID=4432 RepID=A0A822XX45_NELNU|nr:TPA_asm: hypothetical protein HUJ06_023431 [Nelumbo nucifera]
MASFTVDSSTKPLQLESIELVDLRFLSQSELNSLSLCSGDAFDLRRCDDVVIPKIDRSVFNESAGSRKQTYSRLRLAPSKPEVTSIGRRRRHAALLPVPKPPPNPVDDPERKENKQIVSILRELFGKDNSVTELIPLEGDHGEPLSEPLKMENGVSMQQFPVASVDGERKRKRGRKPKPKVEGNGGGMSNAVVVYDSISYVQNRPMEIVNRNGVVVDAASLAKINDPFGPELKRRTSGLQTEAELLGFLRGLNGQWGSRRKKRKIVDASDFGDNLPIGWKLLLSLKRKEGRVWLNCRRYISPSGQQFVSCKEVSSYLISVFGPQDASKLISGHNDESTHVAYKLTSGTISGLIHKDGNTGKSPNFCSISTVAAISSDHDKQVALLRVENLAEVQVRDLLECQKCNMTFDEKDAYLQHLLSFHQKNAKRYRQGSSIADGVIIKDGKYECQFCHKIFQERHRYNGHVGVHMRNYVRSLEASPGEITMQKSIGPPSLGVIPSAVPKMDALLDIDKVPIPETSTAKPNNALNVGSPHSKMGVVLTPETCTAIDNYESGVNSLHNKQAMHSNKIDKSIGNESYDKLDVDPKITDDKSGTLHKDRKTTSVEINSCFDYGSALPAKVENVSSEASCGKDGFASNIVEIDKPATKQENCHMSSLLVPSSNGQTCMVVINSETLLSSDKENVIFETARGKNGSASTNVEVYKPSIEPERSSQSCSFTLYANEQTCRPKNNIDRVLLSTAEEPELDKVENVGSIDIGSGFNDKQAKSGKDSLIEANESTVENNVINSRMVEPSLQQSDCLPTLDQMGSAGSETDVVIEATGDTNENNSMQNAREKPSSLPLVQSSSNCHLTICEMVSGPDGSQEELGKDVLTEASRDADEENAVHSEAVEPLVPSMQSSGCFSTLDEMESQFDGNQVGPAKNVVTEATGGTVEENAIQGMQTSDCFPTLHDMVSGPDGSGEEPGKDVLTEATRDADEENAVQGGIIEPLVPSMQPSDCFPTLDEMESQFDGNQVGPGKNVVTEVTEGTVEENAIQRMQSSGCWPTPIEMGSGPNGNQEEPGKDVLTEATRDADEENAMQSGIMEPLVPSVQSSNCFPTLDEMESELHVIQVQPGKNVVTEDIGGTIEENAIRSATTEPTLPLMQPFDCFPSLDDIGSGLGSSQAGLGKYDETEAIEGTGKEHTTQSGMTEASLVLMQSSDCFPTLDMIPDKEGDDFCNVNQKLDNISSFEELRFDEIEHPELSFVNGQESSSLPGESLDLTYDVELEQGLDASDQFEWETVLPNVASSRLTAVCVWCRIEFNHESITSETHVNSVGFMCPTCKARISGQLNVLDNGLSVNPDQL